MSTVKFPIQPKTVKNVPAPSTLCADGSKKYAEDGVTVEWSKNPKGAWTMACGRL
jgi:hypothetical protein